MKAIKFEKYGSPEKVLRISEVDKPEPKENEVLVKVYATTINDYDWSLVRGKPYLYRLMFGFTKPKNPIPGMELAGIIEKIGSKVKMFKVGDAVFGDISQYGFSSFADFCCVDERALLKKPDYLSMEEAAAIPHALGLAFQAFKQIGGIKDGQKILINGAGGGVGSFAIQLVKMHNCNVTGVDSANKIERLKKLGFDNVIDYKKENFTKNGEKYDVVLDCKTNKPAYSFLRSLSSGGKYITIGGEINNLIMVFVLGKIISLFSSKQLKVLALKPNYGIAEVLELIKENRLKTQIDGPYKFEEIPKLIQYFGNGKHNGKIVVKLN
ncbi:NAD(P)-dependent alcohol dehydrogenase [Lacihabitans sp. LS3-19]|uniref:NAD(P)-dependent alcohol dehydrogenase n=1 Tax=Lacihabitans sp. LS3-19 TaxID=2487335 RepID=UPI0020CF5C7C|nr:NAD(P)-dependent alcohol dehydrogenase [Lacihabitans sp. LS3-19]MCP9768587.1 NAD(P)-dependent alcohol dehydrogenase [Lacihabitans sp. LS3-19]